MSKEYSKYLYEMDRFQFLLVMGAVFFFGFIIAYGIWGDPYEVFFKGCWNKIVNMQPNKTSDFMSLVAKILGTFIAIAIPVSLNIVSNNLSTYKDVSIAKMFRSESEYKWSLNVSMFTIGGIFTLKYFDITHPIFHFIVFGLSILSLVLFYRYIRLIERYSTQTDEIVLEKAKKDIDEIL